MIKAFIYSLLGIEENKHVKRVATSDRKVTLHSIEGLNNLETFSDAVKHNKSLLFTASYTDQFGKVFTAEFTNEGSFIRPLDSGHLSSLSEFEVTEILESYSRKALVYKSLGKTLALPYTVVLETKESVNKSYDAV